MLRKFEHVLDRVTRSNGKSIKKTVILHLLMLNLRYAQIMFGPAVPSACYKVLACNRSSILFYD